MKIIKHDGICWPENITTQHQKFIPNSLAHKQYMKFILGMLSDWHNHAESNNMLYSLCAGSLIGYYWNCSVLPWDDDIDLSLKEQDFFEFKRCSIENGKEPTSIPVFKSGWNSSYNKLIKINEKEYIFSTKTLATHNTGDRELIKIIPLEDLGRRVPGGLDIMFCSLDSDSKTEDSWMPKRPCSGPTDFFDQKDCPIVEFSGVKTRAVKREIGGPVLTSIYGSEWLIKKHPILKNPKKTSGRFPLQF
jgi:hypothetical protein